jgi:signal transduction histidine kinase
LLVLVLAPIGLGAVALAGVGGMFVSGRAMRPVRDAFERQRVFVADASHELKTPLALIRADAEVHLRGLTDPDGRALVEDLLRETDRMSAVLSDLLVLARLDAGRLEVARAPFDLSLAVREAAERFRARADAEEKRLDIAVAPGLAARGDEERAGQILAALLDNALRFTPPGGTVRIVGERDDGRIVASVGDSGIGISPEHMGRVFDRFYRGESARTRDGGGTGLGLAIARDLARAQGGDVTVRGDEGGGALFRLELPQA